MRRFHLLKNREHCPIVNLDKLWSMLPEGTLEQAKAAGGKAPVIDVTDQVQWGFHLVFFMGRAMETTLGLYRFRLDRYINGLASRTS